MAGNSLVLFDPRRTHWSIFRFNINLSDLLQFCVHCDKAEVSWWHGNKRKTASVWKKEWCTWQNISNVIMTSGYEQTNVWKHLIWFCRHTDLSFVVFFSVCADDYPGGTPVWSFAAGALWRSSRETRNTPAQKWIPEFKSHPPRDWHAAGPGRLDPTATFT